MSKELKDAVKNAQNSFKKGDDVGTVSWITRAAGTVPRANSSDEDYEKVFQHLSDFVTKGLDK
jgi:DNA repair ATPase RecN